MQLSILALVLSVLSVATPVLAGQSGSGSPAPATCGSKRSLCYRGMAASQQTDIRKRIDDLGGPENNGITNLDHTMWQCDGQSANWGFVKQCGNCKLGSRRHDDECN